MIFVSTAVNTAEPIRPALAGISFRVQALRTNTDVVALGDAPDQEMRLEGGPTNELVIEDGPDTDTGNGIILQAWEDICLQAPISRWWMATAVSGEGISITRLK